MHIRYLAYVLRHKWFVLVAGLYLGVPLWQLLIHDLSTCWPDEWMPSVRWLYASLPADPAERERWRLAFHQATRRHYRRNPHHPQHWRDLGTYEPCPMPDRYVREMIADWIAIGWERGVGDDVLRWYHDHARRIALHPETRMLVMRHLVRLTRSGRIAA